jgi:two-component system response regulator YesN
MDCTVVGEAMNGVEGIEKIKELEPDIVILDINMPLKDGISMLEDSKEYIYSAIIVSGYDNFDYAKRAIKLGVNEYLLKPIDHNELYESIKNAKESVTLKKQYQYLKSKVPKPDEMKVLDLKMLHESCHNSKNVAYMIDYIKEHYHEKISIQDLVYKLDRSVAHLNQKFKKQTGYTFNEFLNRYRIQAAIDRLKIGEDKISAIAVDVGFNDYRYFINVFKKYTKSLPSEFIELSKIQTLE